MANAEEHQATSMWECYLVYNTHGMEFTVHPYNCSTEQKVQINLAEKKKPTKALQTALTPR